jgi:hypothetical protein
MHYFLILYLALNKYYSRGEEEQNMKKKLKIEYYVVSTDAKIIKHTKAL